MALPPSSASTCMIISAPLMVWPARACATGLVRLAESVTVESLSVQPVATKLSYSASLQPRNGAAAGPLHATHHRHFAAERGGPAGARPPPVFPPPPQKRNTPPPGAPAAPRLPPLPGDEPLPAARAPHDPTPPQTPRS